MEFDVSEFKNWQKKIMGGWDIILPLMDNP
jgi:hypothetical protein